MSELDRVAEANGIALTYVSEKGEKRDASRAGVAAILKVMGIDPSAPGANGMPDRALSEAADQEVPACFVPESLRGNRIWGVTCQLYGLRSSRNWGIGDFADLAELAKRVAAAGGDFVGLSPLHALFPSDPSRSSPYAPSSKRFLNPLYVAPDLEPEYEAIGPVGAEILERLRAEPFVNYPGVAAVKWNALCLMYREFAQGDGARRQAFGAFREKGGESLETHCLFEALSEHFHAEAERPVPWQEWPDDFRSPDAPGSRRFAAAQGDRISYFAWLQWLADSQLARAQQAAREAGMRVGLYVDLAVGVAADSAETWADPALAIEGASIGAPPDMMNARGQDWGLAPLSPVALKERGLAPLRQELAANMRHAGAVRLDHAMALTRLFWVPKGMTPADGAYVHYPLIDMIAAVAEASNSQKALVIAEALGTVPERFTDTLEAANIHAYRVLMFERLRWGGFIRPEDYPAHALACLSTHDLPTLRGWWQGHDIEVRQELGILDDIAAREERETREADRRHLWDALVDAGLVDPGDRLPDDLDDDLAAKLHLFVASTPCRLFAIQLEDALGEIEQPNLPGNTDPHPNWRRKLPVAIEELDASPRFSAICRAVALERPRR
ncbi:4-alpha-glucanotransferase [Rhodoligotrophos defluvii]|uniref:4-alpha-glucanotransferase n=1 Tax=Rhodoligotrophos defluvii TaxID=2561934 RepID=UPI0010C9AF2D|nr:4-alpha-glucanotransferase [Rhodoligotrophos defluvii]